MAELSTEEVQVLLEAELAERGLHLVDLAPNQRYVAGEVLSKVGDMAAALGSDRDLLLAMSAALAVGARITGRDRG